MALLYHPSFDPSRVYYGTDTRAFELLVGAALAMVWPSRRLRPDVAAARPATCSTRMGVVGLIVIALMIWRTSEFSPFLYRGGFVLLSLATVLVIAALAHPACRLGPSLGCRPMRWIGVRSYGIYLWHFPIIVLTTPAGDARHRPPRATPLQVAATFGVAALSWRFVEEPIRHGALGRLWAQPEIGWMAPGGHPAQGLGGPGGLVRRRSPWRSPASRAWGPGRRPNRPQLRAAPRRGRSGCGRREATAEQPPGASQHRHAPPATPSSTSATRPRRD